MKLSFFQQTHTAKMRGRKPITLSVGPPRCQMKQGISGTVTRNRGGGGVDHAVVDLFRVDRPAKELVAASCLIPVSKVDLRS